LADVVPDLADDLAARQRIGTRDRGEVRRGLHRTLQTALTICHYCLPVVFVRPIERNSPLLAMGAERRNGLVSRHFARFLWIEPAREAPNLRSARTGPLYWLSRARCRRGPERRSPPARTRASRPRFRPRQRPDRWAARR